MFYDWLCPLVECFVSYHFQAIYRNIALRRGPSSVTHGSIGLLRMTQTKGESDAGAGVASKVKLTSRVLLLDVFNSTIVDWVLYYYLVRLVSHD